MAQELTLTATLVFAKGNVVQLTRTMAGVKFDVAGSRYVQGVQNLSNVASAIDVNGITPGWGWFKNLDATQTISLRNGNAGADVADLKPGEFCMFRIKSGATLYAIAGAGTPQLEYLIVES